MAGVLSCRDCLALSLYFFVGLGSWLLVTAVFAEASFFVNVLGKDKTLYSSLDLAVQCANIVPAVVVMHSLLPSQRRTVRPGTAKRRNSILVGALYCVAVASWCVLAAAGRKGKASTVDAGSVRTMLMIGSVGAGIVGSTSMVSFFGIIQHGHANGFAAMSTGIGVCGLVTQVLAVIQGLGSSSTPPRFSVHTFFLSGLCLQLVSAAAFAVLVRSAKVTTESQSSDSQEAALLEEGSGEAFPEEEESILVLLKRNIYVLRNITVSCAMEYAVPGLLPYLVPESGSKTMPGTDTFWITLWFFVGSCLGRLASGLRNALLQQEKPERLNVYNFAAFCILVYMLIISHAVHEKSSRVPPLGVSAFFVFLFSFIHGFVVTRCFTIAGSKSALLVKLTGMLNQGGALCGALATFILVHVGVIR